jgi:sulfite reductase (ferredoxin)
VGEFQRLARPIGYRCIAQEVPAAIERLLAAYVAGRNEHESLRAYFARFSDEELRTQFAGAAATIILRDSPAGVIPEGVRGC